jgi:hypothetical protein
MTPDKLKEFYKDKAMMDAVAAHFVTVLHAIAIERVFKKQDTTALPDARDILKRGFAELKDRYEPRKERPTENRSV